MKTVNRVIYRNDAGGRVVLPAGTEITDEHKMPQAIRENLLERGALLDDGKPAPKATSKPKNTKKDAEPDGAL